MTRLPHRSYEFGVFRVDVVERQLWRGDQNIPLTAKVFDLLLALVEKPGRTVKKEDLIDRIWSDTFVEEGNLNRNISTLRKILGDDVHESKIIKTIPKRGYRFIADVREVAHTRDEMLVENKTSYAFRFSEETREESSWGVVSARSLLFVGGIVLLSITIAWVWNRPPSSGVNAAAISPSSKTEALDLYKKARALWQTRNGEDLHLATLMLEQAVQKDPDLAIAHAALADAYAFDFRYWQRAESVAREAIRLDPSLGKPHATIGFVRMFWEWDLVAAESELRQAVHLSPGYATGHQWYAISLFSLGNAGNGGIAEMKAALQLDPGSPSINADMCQAFYFNRRFEEAIEQCKRALDLSPDFANAYNYLYEIYNANGQFDEAVEIYFRIESIAAKPATPDAQQKLRAAYSGGGAIHAFWSERLEQLIAAGYPLHYRIAQHYARLGKTDEALGHLRQAYDARDFEFYLFLADPVFDGLRTDPRYRDLETR